MALNDKQKRFCEEYLVDYNATQAATRAGYSEKTAYSQGHDLLKKPEIVAYIDELKEKTAAKLNITRERVMQELGRLAFFDVRKLYDDNGMPLPLSELDDDTAAAIVGLDYATKGNAEIGTADILKIKLADKKGALELLGKHFKLFTDQVEHSGNVVLTDAESARRIAFVLARAAKGDKKA